MKKKRCFAFGCSFTNYNWPTCADLIGSNFDNYYNFGRPGSDNTYALNRLTDSHSFFHLNPDTDFVIFGTTAFGRFSFWDKNNAWVTAGDIDFERSNIEYKEQNTFSVTQNYTPTYAAYRSINAIKMFKYFLQSMDIPHIIFPAIDNVQYYMDSMYYPDNLHVGLWAIEEAEKLLDLYSIKFSMEEFIIENPQNRSQTKFICENFIDSHPTTAIHYKYLQRFLPDFDSDIVKEIVSKFNMTEYKYIKDCKDYMANVYINRYRKDNDIKHTLFLGPN